MNKEQFTERLQAIGTETDEGQRLELIAQLIEDGGADYDDHAAAITARDQAQQQVTSLQETNKKLLLRVGTKKEPDQPDPNNKPPEKRSFKDLFNEKGGIK